jgi:hypothetical protein
MPYAHVRLRQAKVVGLRRPPTVIRLNSHVPLCQPHFSTHCGDSTSDHPASRRLLSPRRSSAILPEYTNPSNMRQADAKTLAIAKCRPGSVFGTDMTLCSAPGDLFKHIPIHRFRRKRRQQNLHGETGERMHMSSGNKNHKCIGYSRRQASPMAHGQDPSH